MNDEALGNRAKFAAKLARAQMELPPLPKDKRREDKKYNYTSAEAVFAGCGKALFRNNLAFLPSIKNVARPDEAKPNKVAVTVTVTIIDTETGYSEEREAYAEATGYNDDTEIQKAVTVALRMFLKALFLTSDEGDFGEGDQEISKSQRQQPQQGQQPAAGNDTPPAAAPPAQVTPTGNGDAPAAPGAKRPPISKMQADNIAKLWGETPHDEAEDPYMKHAGKPQAECSYAEAGKVIAALIQAQRLAAKTPA